MAKYIYFPESKSELANTATFLSRIQTTIKEWIGPKDETDKMLVTLPGYIRVTEQNKVEMNDTQLTTLILSLKDGDILSVRSIMDLADNTDQCLTVAALILGRGATLVDFKQGIIAQYKETEDLSRNGKKLFISIL